MFERHCVAANSLGAESPSTLTGCTRPSTMSSFHWSKMVSFQSPLGISGKVTFTDIPKGDWKLTIFDQWNELIVDGLVQPVRVDGDSAPKLFAATQWRSNIYTRTFIDSNGDGVSQG